MPPLVGYAAASGNLTLTAVVLFAIVFVWTPPHFWALALLIKENYAAAKVPMLPVVRGDDETARQILWYSVALVAVTLRADAARHARPRLRAGALGARRLFIWLAWRLRRETTRPRAAFLFHYSLLYLALLFVVMAIDLVV